MRYGLPLILICVGILTLPTPLWYQLKSTNESATDIFSGREISALSQCRGSFEGDPSNYLSCIGEKLSPEEINNIIVYDVKASSERSEFAKAIRSTTGISIDDIKQHGILDGENSEIKKLVPYYFKIKAPIVYSLGYQAKPTTAQNMRSY